MRKTGPSFTRAARSASFTGSPQTAQTPPIDALPVRLLPTLISQYLLDGDMSRHSARTAASRRDLLGKLDWFAAREQISTLDTASLRLFFHHVTHGHEEAGGRWGNPRMTRPTKPGTVATYFRIVRAFFNWCVKEKTLSVSPMERITPPVDRPDQVQPFTGEQVAALFRAAKRTTHPARDEAVLFLLLDTGLRVSELAALRVSDVDLLAGHVTVRSGKGGKLRRVPFSLHTRRALYQCLNERDSAPSEAFFQSDRGTNAGGGLTRRGLLQLMHRLGASAGIEAAAARCSPHTFRHTFAVLYLRAGGNVFALKELLGHTSLAIVNRYVALAQADLATAHAKFSPVLLLNNGERKG